MVTLFMYKKNIRGPTFFSEQEPDRPWLSHPHPAFYHLPGLAGQLAGPVNRAGIWKNPLRPCWLSVSRL